MRWRQTSCAPHLEGPTRDGIHRPQARVTSRVPRLDAARPILDVLAQPVVVTDLEATIIYWNKAATDLYGFSSDEALGHCLYALVQSAPGMFDENTMAQRLLDGRSLTHHLEGRSRSGKALTVLMTVTPLRQENG